LRLLHVLRERPYSRADIVAAITDHTEHIIAKCLRMLKNKRLVRIRYNPVCVYDLTNDGYIVCEHYPHQD
jgi:predicted MarR family transcription regulator